MVSAFNDYCDNKDKNWKCNTCILKYCMKCDLTLKSSTGSNIYRLICKYKYHLKCSGVTKDRLQKIEDIDDGWQCRNCYSNTFPFHKLNNN